MFQNLFNSQSKSKDSSSKVSLSQRKREKFSLKDLKPLIVVTSFFTAVYVFAFWGSKKLILHYGFPADEASRLANNVVSVLHALMIVPISTLYLTNRISLSTWRRIAGVSLSYFLVDILILPFYIRTMHEFILYGIHHMVLLIVVTFYLHSHPRLIAQGLLAELTAPFLYLCKFLVKMGHEKTAVFKFFAGLTILTWCTLRVMNFTYIYRQLYKKKAPFIGYVLFAPVVLMNYYWFYKLLEKAFCH